MAPWGCHGIRAALLPSLCFDFHHSYVLFLSWKYHPLILAVSAEGTPAHHLPCWWMGVPWVQPKMLAGTKKSLKGRNVSSLKTHLPYT